MAAKSGYGVAQREDLRDERDAQVGRQEGGDSQVTVSGADSVRVRVHQYERCFRRKPDRRVSADEVCAGLSHDIGGALHAGTGQSAVPPDDSDKHLGRERPPFFKRGTSTGGWQRGSLTPQMSCSRQPTAALTLTRAAQSAARSRRHGTRRWRRTSPHPWRPSAYVDFAAHALPKRSASRGTLLPRLCSPLSFRRAGRN